MTTRSARRFLERVHFNVRNGCWEWQSMKNNHGYGRFHAGGRRRLAHRLAYESWIGPIQSGLELDHLCRTPACVNPFHLEPVTHAENMRRWAPYSGWAKRDACCRGHKYVDGSFRMSGRARVCRICMKENMDRFKARKVA